MHDVAPSQVASPHPDFSVSLEWNPQPVPEVKPDRYNEELATLQAAIEEKRAFKTHRMERLPKPIRKILRPERKQRHSLKLRTPEEWSVMVRKIKPTALRCRVACLVWWDYFANRSISERWPHLDQYLEAPVPDVSIEDIRRGLYSIGYTAVQAHDRIQASYYTKPSYIPVGEGNSNDN